MRIKLLGLTILVFLNLNHLLSQTGKFDTYQNPIIRGFHPDPSICRVGEDYYLVNSSFEFFPGVPIFHSRDLVHWEQIGNCLTRQSQLPLSRVPSSGGIYAPTIRYNKGVFYMITTNVNHGGIFFVTTTNPVDSWSDPVWLDQGGIDPSLFFDEDGKVYLQSNGGPDGIYQSEIDIKTGKRLTEIRHLWSGTGGRYPEGPHIYKKDGWYYLMIAEGGTEYGHMETIARSRDIWGPFEADPVNPILTHRNKNNQSNPIQGTGHADLTDTPDGSWWIVCLAFRTAGGYSQFHHLGRETFLAPVQWLPSEWPIVNKDGSLALNMNANLLAKQSYPERIKRDQFDNLERDFQWNFLRNPEVKNYSTTEKIGFLALTPSAFTLDSSASPTFIGRRQEDFNCEFSTAMEYDPQPGYVAGITCYMSPLAHYDIGYTADSKGKYLFLSLRAGSIIDLQNKIYVNSSRLILKIKADAYLYSFFASVDDGKTFLPLGKAETKYLSSEVAGGFTGVFFGLFCSGHGQEQAKHAYFNWAEYSPLD